MGKYVLILLSAALVVALFSMPAFPRGNGSGGGGTPSHGAGATPSGSPSPSGKALQAA